MTSWSQFEFYVSESKLTPVIRYLRLCRRCLTRPGNYPKLKPDWDNYREVILFKNPWKLHPTLTPSPFVYRPTSVIVVIIIQSVCDDIFTFTCIHTFWCDRNWTLKLSRQYRTITFLLLKKDINYHVNN